MEVILAFLKIATNIFFEFGLVMPGYFTWIIDVLVLQL